jgi:hypothetical protein
MTCVGRLAAALALSGALPLFSYAQAPPAPAPPSPPSTNPSPSAVRPAQPGALSAQAQNKAASQPRYRRRSIVQHYPYPYPDYYHGDQQAGFRNPGGVGRYMEYYPPGNQFQVANDPVRVAHFDTGPGNRQEQFQSLQIGVQRDNAIMNHIDRYARPYFGIGFFGGFY